MKNILYLFTILLALLYCASCTQNSQQNNTNSLDEQTEKTTPEIINGSFAHIVFFWLVEPENQKSRNKLSTELTNFIINSPYVRTWHLGTPANTNRPVVDNSYTYCLIVTFSSKEEQDKYQSDPEHTKFLNSCKQLWKKVLVYDSTL